MTQHSESPDRLSEEAMSLYKAGDYSQAIQIFTAARKMFLASALTERAAEMSNNLCVCLLQLDRPGEALSEVKDTPNIFHTSGNLPLKAQALGNRAMAKAALGQIAEAEADYRAAAKIFRDLKHEEGLQYTVQALSKLQLQNGRPMEALDAMQSVMNSGPKPSLRKRFLGWLFKLPLRLFGR